METKTQITTAYSETEDITFILKEQQDNNGNSVSTEVVGFYYGQPNEDDTTRYTGKLKAQY